MKDLSREERTKQHISKLEKRIFEMSKEGKKNKWLRIKLTFFILSGLVYVIATPFCDSVIWLLVWLIFAPLTTIGVMSTSYVILAYILNGVIKDAFNIGQVVGRKDAIELSKHNDCEYEKIEEIKADLNILNTLLRDIIDEYKNLELNEDYENDAEENEILKLHLEDLKFSLKMIDKEYEYLKRKKVFDDEVKENEED